MTVQPGALLSWMIREVTGELSTNCGRCANRVATMNEKGWWWCWRNRQTIVGWIVQEAAIRGIQIDNNSVSKLIITAFRQFQQYKNQKGVELVQTYVIVKTYTVDAESIEGALAKQATAELVAVNVTKRPTANLPPTLNVPKPA